MYLLNTVPNYISKLKHLRYLDLSGSDIKALPNSISKLQNLRTLKLNRCFHLEELPRDIRKLVSLRHLEFDQCLKLNSMLPWGLGQLTSLLTLTRFGVDSNSRLSELQSLNNLCGRLTIEILGRRDSSSPQCLKNATAKGAEATNYLEAKKHLKSLILCFDRVDHDDDELLLESLRPHLNLKELKIEYYGGMSFPSWMMMVDKVGLSLPNLIRITIDSCDKCKHLPLFGQLPSLQFLCLSFMYSLEYIDNSSTGSDGEVSLSSLPSSSSLIRRSEQTPTPTFFPSLKELQLHPMPNLKGWWREAVEEEATTSSATLLDQQKHQQQHYWLPSFPSLSKLNIEYCPNLTSMPILQPCLEQLHLENVSNKLVEQQLMMTVPPIASKSSSSSSSSLLHLSKLKTLSVVNIQDLVTLPECIGNLTSLDRLFVGNCPNLTSLPKGMQRLAALQQLTITSCTDVLYDRCHKETGDDWPKIAHIRNVYIA
ncbi:putative disease resistance protein RGA4 [Cornus florida]|uniref:putative disease resistance protein RGA4 n=1 Tax=Cornus florida TaxID=4283 RepID=UPI0028A2C9C0|nr:putative disease resistance protein RGA4 [Cornus florida]